MGAAVWQAVSHLGANNPIVVITDETTSTASTGDVQSQIKDAVGRALRAWTTDGYGTPGTVEKNVAPAMPTAAELAQQRDAGYADAARYCGPSLAARLREQIDRGLEAQQDPSFRALGAGIKNLVIESVTLDDAGSTATVVATFTHWANSADKNPDSGTWTVYTPSNDSRATITMQRQASGNWVMTDYSAEFINGTEP